MTASRPSRTLLASLLVLLLPSIGLGDSDPLANIWRSSDAVEAEPPALWGHVMGGLGGLVFMYGGLYSKRQSLEATDSTLMVNSVLYTYSLSSQGWLWDSSTLLPQGGNCSLHTRLDRPPPLFYSAATIATIDVNGTNTAVLAMYGGYCAAPGVVGDMSDQLWFLNMATRTWLRKTKNRIHSLWPTSLVLSSMSFYEGHLVLFGGIASDSKVSKEMWLLNLASNEWEKLAVVGPSLRFGASMAGIKSGIYLRDGLTPRNPNAVVDGEALSEEFEYVPADDFWRFDFKTRSWTHVGLPPNVPRPESGFSSCMEAIPEESGTSLDTANATQMILSLGQLSFTEFRTITWAYDDTNGWTKFNDMSDARMNQACSIVGDGLFVFGGRNILVVLRNFVAFDLLRAYWGSVFVDAQPEKSFFPSATVLRQKAYTFGGFDGGSVFNTLWELDLDINGGDWQVPVVASPPASRFGCSLTPIEGESVLGDRLVMFGGFDGVRAFNDIWQFHVDDSEWVELTNPTSPRASPRTLHSANLVTTPTCSQALVIVGGFEFRILPVGFVTHSVNSTWLYCVPTNEWSEVLSANPPVGRGGHVAAAFDKRHLVIYGGQTGSGFILDDVWLLDMDVEEWRSLGASPAGKRYGADAANVGTAVLVTGGYDLPGTTGNIFPLGSNMSDTWTMRWSDDSGGTVEWYRVNSKPAQSYSLGQLLAPGPSSPFYGDVFVFLGATAEGLSVSATELPTLRPLCNAGDFSPMFANSSCRPCPLGSFAPTDGFDKCIPCANGTTTAATGATSIEQCSICVTEYCGVHGTCNGVTDQHAVCKCQGGYSGSQCEQYSPSQSAMHAGTIAILVLVSFLGMIAFGFGGYYLHRRYKLQKTYHFFISYRVKTDAQLAARLCNTLQAQELDSKVTVRCFLDQNDIEEGADWEQQFSTALARSCVFLPIISAAAIKPIEEVSCFDETPDNLLFEYELALRLMQAKRVLVLPLLVGTVDNGEYVRFSDTEFDVSRFPNGPSRTNLKRSVRETMRQLFKIQGLFVDPRGLTEEQLGSVLDFVKYRALGNHGTGGRNFSKYWRQPRSTANSTIKSVPLLTSVVAAMRPASVRLAAPSTTQPAKPSESDDLGVPLLAVAADVDDGDDDFSSNSGKATSNSFC
eukprot:m.263300 g.263300  ORF g.263300 m.263300 type:complete len:1146 (-) comp19240_c2_seq14:75-3512(-)